MSSSVFVRSATARSIRSYWSDVPWRRQKGVAIVACLRSGRGDLVLRQFAAPASSAQRLLGHDQPCGHDWPGRSTDAQLTDDAEQHVGLLAAEAGALQR